LESFASRSRHRHAARPDWLPQSSRDRRAVSTREAAGAHRAPRPTSQGRLTERSCAGPATQAEGDGAGQPVRRSSRRRGRFGG
jgi:hypothetical protein